MKESSIEEDINRINCIFEFQEKMGCQYVLETEDERAIKHLLSDYKRVLEENEILKKEKEQAWEEWNNLEQGSYETEQKLKQQIKESQRENEALKSENRRLKVIRYSTEYGTENIHLITKSDLVQIDINKYMIEIEKRKVC